MTPLNMTLTPVAGGYRVKETETYYIDVVRMLFNWRISTSYKTAPGHPVRGWCYAGLSPNVFAAAILAAHAWNGADDTEPGGWNKNIQTGEWREPVHRHQ